MGGCVHVHVQSPKCHDGDVIDVKLARVVGERDDERGTANVTSDKEWMRCILLLSVAE